MNIHHSRLFPFAPPPKNPILVRISVSTPDVILLRKSLFVLLCFAFLQLSLTLYLSVSFSVLFLNDLRIRIEIYRQFLVCVSHTESEILYAS